MKTCYICKKDKEITEFHKNKTKPDGLDGRCKLCKHEYNLANRTKLAIAKHQRYLLNKKEINTKNKEWYVENPNKVKNQKLRYKYGIDLEQWTKMLKNQNFECKICSTKLDPTKDSKGIHVDHNHSTGKIRAILCKKCNSIIGLCGENKTILNNTIEYLTKHNE